MAQHDYIIANQSGAAFRNDLNVALAAVATNNSPDTGTAAPSTTYRYQWWADPGTGLLKIRNAANSAWITVGTLADTNLGLLAQSGGTLTGALLADDSGTAALPAIAFDGDPNTGIFRPAADQLGIATNGVERVEFGTSEVVFNDGGADVDLRVEGDTKANLLLVDAGADTVSIDGTQQLANQTPLRFGDSDNSHYVALRSPATVSTNVTWDLPATDGTASQALTTNGSSVLGWSTFLTEGTAITARTSVPSTSGASIDFASIPSWVKRITVMFQGVSTSAGSPVIIQLGTGSTPTYTTSGYLGSVLLVDAAGATARTTYTTGFLVTQDSANAHVRHGNITITNITGNSWTQTGLLAQSDETRTHHSAGSIALAAVLTAVRITTVGGSQTFDLGAINLLLEG